MEHYFVIGPLPEASVQLIFFVTSLVCTNVRPEIFENVGPRFKNVGSGS